MATSTTAKKQKPAAEGDNTQSAAPGVTLTMIRLSDLFPSPTNPRKTFPETELRELSDSIKANGLINPITVRAVPAVPGQYEVISGGRRYRASIMAGLLEIPCIVRELSDAQVIDMQIEENLHRQDVPALEEAEAFESLITAGKLTVNELAGRLNKSAAYVYRRLKLNNLDEKYRQFLTSGELAPATAEVIASYPQSVQVSMFKKVSYTDGAKTTFVETRSMREKFKWEACTDLKKANWPLDREGLQPGLQSCSTCEKNTAVATLLFPDGADNPRCTDKACWKIKESVWKALALGEWEAYCKDKGIKAVYADLHYYTMNDKKIVESVLGYSPEVVERYNYEVVEEGTPGATEVLFVGAEQWYDEERAKNYTRGFIVPTERQTSRGNGDWEMERIDKMDVSEEEKTRLRAEVVEKRRRIVEENALLNQEQKWKLEILENVHAKFSVGDTMDGALIQLIRLYVRSEVNGYQMRSQWLDLFGKWAKGWKPQSFAIKVNGHGENEAMNPNWTKGVASAWEEVLEKKQRKGEYGTMDERAWADWITDADKGKFLDDVILGLTPEAVVAMFADLSLRSIASRIKDNRRDRYDMDFFMFMCDTTGIDMAALKPELNLDESDTEEDDDEDDFDNDFTPDEEGEDEE